MKFYIGASVFQISNNEHVEWIRTCGDDHFKVGIEIQDDDFEYYFYNGKEELYLNSIEEIIEDKMSVITEQITEKIKSELRLKIKRQRT